MIFNAGQRVCIGRQAAIVEATGFIARTVAKYKIEAPAAEADEWKLKPGESEMDRRERIYKVSTHSMLGPTGVTLLTVDGGIPAYPRDHPHPAVATQRRLRCARLSEQTVATV